MKNKKLLYIIIGIIVVIIVSVLIFSIVNRNKEPLERPEDSHQSKKTSTKTSISEQIESDLDKYRESKTVSNSETNPDKANKKGIFLNADNKVLVQTDSNNAEDIKEAMVKWNSALGENVFIPSSNGGRADLLIQDDETKLPVDIYRNTNYEEDMPQEYMKRVTPTKDHRIMILDNVNTRLSDEFENTLKDEINQSLGQTIGINKDVDEIKNLFRSEEGRNELKKQFEQVKSEGIYNKSLTSKDKETEYMDSTYNKTYATWTNLRDSIENLPRFKGHNKELLSIIDSKNETLYDRESIQQGKDINKALQNAMKEMDKAGSYNSTEGKYNDDKDMYDSHITIAKTSSKMGDDNDFINLTKDYTGVR
ncbi:TPA: hypothetical protein PIS85_001073 [Staphylococcus aureus]|nr:hypothetical protein [Staphylococcus aureus]